MCEIKAFFVVLHTFFRETNNVKLTVSVFILDRFFHKCIMCTVNAYTMSKCFLPMQSILS